MFLTNISAAKEWFEVLQTTGRAQTAIMNLDAGEASGDEAEAHEKSDQVLLVLEGELLAEIAEERAHLRKGDVVIVPAGIKHRFANESGKPASTFSVYAPPAYPAGTAG